MVDSQSTDKTTKIAEKQDLQVVQFNYSGDGQKRKIGWQLPFLVNGFNHDADECLPPEAETESSRLFQILRKTH